jgi:hypothetical protein
LVLGEKSMKAETQSMPRQPCHIPFVLEAAF